MHDEDNGPEGPRIEFNTVKAGCGIRFDPETLSDEAGFDFTSSHDDLNPLEIRTALDNIVLHENNPLYLADFIRLNEAWISHYFKLESVDHALAQDPAKIIREGGFILTLTQKEESANTVLGVCALFNKGHEGFELARMAVDPNYQGRGLANLLMRACLDKLNKLQANRVFLVSNTKLEKAINLYQKYGFQTVHLGQHPNYARANIVMEKQLD